MRKKSFKNDLQKCVDKELWQKKEEDFFVEAWKGFSNVVKKIEEEAAKNNHVGDTILIPLIDTHEQATRNRSNQLRIMEVKI